jgi:hypothetical protein
VLGGTSSKTLVTFWWVTVNLASKNTVLFTVTAVKSYGFIIKFRLYSGILHPIHFPLFTALGLSSG